MRFFKYVSNDIFWQQQEALSNPPACNLVARVWPNISTGYFSQNMILQAKTRNEVAAEYGISTRTLKRWLQKHNITITERNLISPKDLKVIYVAFGNPKLSNDG